MSKSASDLSRLTSEVLKTWYGYALPEGTEERAGADIARLSEAFRRLTPPPFNLQAHHFQPLLEDYADE